MAAYPGHTAGHANAQTVQIQFFFEVHNLTATPWRYHRDGTRKPSKRPRDHTRSRESICFFFDGLTTHVVSQVPNHIRQHKLDAFSIYQSDQKFTVTPGDVTEMAEDTDSDTDTDTNEEENTIPWRRLTFQKVEAAGGQRRVSYLDVRQDKTQLILQRSNQTWPERLFPDPYLAPRSDRNSTNPERGGLVGRLALLIGLLVMSLPSRWDVVQHRLPSMIRHSPTDGRPAWMADHPPPPRGIGCEAFPCLLAFQLVHSNADKGAIGEHPRGLVVTIYYDPARTTEAVLRRYERGGFGVLFR